MKLVLVQHDRPQKMDTLVPSKTSFARLWNFENQLYMLHGRPHPISPMINYSNLLLQTLRLIFLNFQNQKSQTAPAKLRNYPAPPAPKTPQKAPPVKGPPGGSVAAASPAPPPGLTKQAPATWKSPPSIDRGGPGDPGVSLRVKLGNFWGPGHGKIYLVYALIFWCVCRRMGHPLLGESI